MDRRENRHGNAGHRCRRLGSAALGLLLALVASMASTGAEARRVRLGPWETVHGDRYGFMIAYPASVFTPRDAVPREEGQVLVSRDGGARLLIGTFTNEAEATLEEYREQLLTENYDGADLDYAPVRKRWFVLSGTRGDMHFYERVSLTCGGRLINSWALLYPVSERHIYDPIVEAVAPTYSPGAGRTGQCD
jgi:hypothetical protein